MRMMQCELGHRERCAFVKTGRIDTCDCGFVSSVEERFAKRWDKSYWAPGEPVFEHYKRQVTRGFSPR